MAKSKGAAGTRGDAGGKVKTIPPTFPVYDPRLKMIGVWGLFDLFFFMFFFSGDQGAVPVHRGGEAALQDRQGGGGAGDEQAGREERAVPGDHQAGGLPPQPHPEALPRHRHVRAPPPPHQALPTRVWYCCPYSSSISSSGNYHLRLPPFFFGNSWVLTPRCLF